MKIIYTCTYSAGISGVWNRVYNVALEMIKKGHKVFVFSSDLEAGTGNIAKAHEKVKGIEVFRFPARSFGSKNAYIYNRKELAEKLREVMPDVVDCQTYRHHEGEITSGECKKLGIPCFLTTHAPFVEKNVRGKWLSFLSSFYDVFKGKRTLKRFKKIIAISRWEYPYLNKLGIKNSKIEYVSNGIPAEFFKKQRNFGNKVRKVLFFGRIIPVKDLKTLLRAWSMIEKENKAIELSIVGPADENYKKELDSLIRELKLRNVKFLGAVFDLKKKIAVYDRADIFVLPSKREGMPQVLVEAMARGNIVIASDITANKEIVKDGKNGFLFKQGDAEELADKLKMVIGEYGRLKKIAQGGMKDSSAFRWSELSAKLEKVYKS